MLRTLLAGAAPLALLVLTPPAHDLRAASVAGERLRTTHSFESVAKVVGGRMEIETGGAAQVSDMPAVDRAIEVSANLVFLDVVGEVADGARTRFARTFEVLELEQRIRDEGEVSEDPGRSVLAGRTVEFSLVEAGWSAHVEAGDHGVEAEHLELLMADLSFGALLPAAAVEVGDEWELTQQALTALLWPSGYLHVVRKSMDADVMRATALRRLESAALGEATCRLVSVEDGLARVAFEAREYTESWKDPARELEQEGVTFDTQRSHELSRDFAGEFSWDVRAHRLRSLRVEAQSVAKLVERREAQGLDLAVVFTTELEGEDVIEVRVATD